MDREARMIEKKAGLLTVRWAANSLLCAVWLCTQKLPLPSCSSDQLSIAPGSWRLHKILAISLKENIFPQESQELLCRCATVPRALCRFFKNPSSGDNWCPLFVTWRPPFLKWRSLNTKQCLWSSIKVKQAWRSQSLLAEGPKSWAKGPKNQTEEAKS